MPLPLGSIAPAFELMNQSFAKISLAGLRGKKVVLLFYPMDFSPVCTTEHCTFGPGVGDISKDASTIIFGVNCDSPFSHQAYQKQYNIPYDLLSDPTREMVKAYDMFGGLVPFNCAKRGTVVIDAEGKISHWEEVSMDHPRELRSVVEAVGS